jgi:hypothetical protein
VYQRLKSRSTFVKSAAEAPACASSRWAKAVDLPGKLRTMRVARAQNGEAFGLLVTNDRLNTPAQLDNGLLDADRPFMPLMFRPTPTFIGGVMLDKNANPRSNEA